MIHLSVDNLEERLVDMLNMPNHLLVLLENCCKGHCKPFAWGKPFEYWICRDKMKNDPKFLASQFLGSEKRPERKVECR